MRANIVYIVLAVIAVILVVGNSDLNPNKKPNPNVSIKDYDRSNPKHPMHGIYSDSNCPVEEQVKGIYKCP